MHCLKFSFLFLLMSTGLCIHGQEKPVDEKAFGRQIFLPSIEMGYAGSSASALSGGLITKTSIEFRLRNNNDIFARINYDIINSEYTLENVNTTNIIKGKASFNDLLAGIGYRFGDEKFRCFLMVQPGVRFYNYPIALQQGNEITIDQSGNNIFMTRATVGLEYYFDAKTAISFDVFQNQIWEARDFWNDRGDSYGLSIGVITSLF